MLNGAFYFNYTNELLLLILRNTQISFLVLFYVYFIINDRLKLTERPLIVKKLFFA